MIAIINVIAVVCSVVGLLGIVDTVWFYVTGSRSPIANVAITLNWPSFARYINLFDGDHPWTRHSIAKRRVSALARLERDGHCIHRILHLAMQRSTLYGGYTIF
jgi:hypothetical protein